MLLRTQTPAEVRVTVVLDAVMVAVLPFDEAESKGWVVGSGHHLVGGQPARVLSGLAGLDSRQGGP